MDAFSRQRFYGLSFILDSAFVRLEGRFDFLGVEDIKPAFPFLRQIPVHRGPIHWSGIVISIGFLAHEFPPPPRIAYFVSLSPGAPIFPSGLCSS
jgi:hypothetical protein